MSVYNVIYLNTLVINMYDLPQTGQFVILTGLYKTVDQNNVMPFILNLLYSEPKSWVVPRLRLQMRKRVLLNILI